MRKQKAHALPIMRSPNRLGKCRTNIHNPQSRTRLNLLPKRNRIGNHDPAQLTPVQCLNRIPAQNSMSDDSNDFPSSMVHDCFGGFDKRAACVSHVVYENCDFVLDVSDEDHAGDFVRAGAFFVDEGEAEVEAVGD